MLATYQQRNLLSRINVSHETLIQVHAVIKTLVQVTEDGTLKDSYVELEDVLNSVCKDNNDTINHIAMSLSCRLGGGRGEDDPTPTKTNNGRYLPLVRAQRRVNS